MKFTVTNPLLPVADRTEWLNNTSGARGTNVPESVISVSAPDGNLAVPMDYEIRITETGADTSVSLSSRNRIVTNFSVWDVTDLNMPRRVPFQLTEPRVPPVPGDTVRGQLSPGDVINLRVSGIQLGSYTYYSRSTWRLQVDPSANAIRALDVISVAANALYDSLATYAVRGLQRRPWGLDLESNEILPFLEDINVWYDSVLDSLLAVPGLGSTVQSAATPGEALETLTRLANFEMPENGDVFLLETSKPFDRDDVLRFAVDGVRTEEDPEEGILDDIYVVPDPYVAVSSLESRSILLSGRGERRIDFRNLPQECTIRIFSMSGRQIKEIYHTSPATRSIATWNLQSDDGPGRVLWRVYLSCRRARDW